MIGRWDQKGFPHKGWHCVGVADLGGDGPMEDADYATCEMCGQERIRYVHTMEHPNLADTIDVGCICAGKMSGDYAGAKEREKYLRNKAARKAKWLSRKWRTSAKGNPFLNAEGMNVGIHQAGRRWGYRIEGRFSISTFPTADEAKLALFEAFWRTLHEDEISN